MQGVFLDFATVSHGDVDVGRLAHAVPHLALHDVTAESEIPRHIAGREIVLVNKLHLSRSLMSANPQLRLIAVAATGTNNIDLEAARELSIGVCNVRDYCTASVAQHVLAVMLGLTHHLSDYHRVATDGTWASSPQFTSLEYPIRELRGRVLGIVGYGTLGRAVANAAEAALGMRIAIAQRPGAESAGASGSERLPLDELLRTADVVSLHLPLTEATRNVIGARELALMKRDAILINTARGALIDGEALAAALRARRLGGAAIDVLPQEPPVDGHPLLNSHLPNLIVTPHVAWAAREARQRCVDELAANIEDFLRGGRRNRVV